MGKDFKIMELLNDVRDAVLAELDGLVTAVRKLSDDELAKPSGCAGWSRFDVGAHVAAVMDAQQEAFARMLDGSTETPAYADHTFDSASAMRDALDTAHQRAVDTYMRVSAADAEKPVPIPFGTFPCAAALDIVLLEYGVHRWDIEQDQLTDDTARAVLRLAPGFVAFFGVTPAPDGVAYRIEAPADTIDVSARDGAWVLEPGTDPQVVSGDNSTVALYLMGRDPAAGDFKRWFPGP